MIEWLMVRIRASSMLLASVIVISLVSECMSVSVGQKAPDFRVVSGSGETLTSDAIKGKVAVIFYETKDTKEKNRALKNELNKYYESEPDSLQKNILRIAVIRCSAFMPNIWRRSLRENSKKEGIMIYGDWDGAMERGYAMIEDESNFIIVDKAGMVSDARSGVIPAGEFEGIKRSLSELLSK